MADYSNPAEKAAKKGRPYRIAIVLAIIAFLVVAPEVNSGNAMNPTIKDGQLLIVSKSHYSAKRKAPKHDKLVILDKGLSLNVANDNIITRVIAVPGDTVEIADGKVYVNEEEYETASGIKGAKGTYKKRKLKGNQVFVLCDNRKVTKYDSRNPELGLVDMRKIKGNVLLRVWSISSFGVMTDK